MYVFGCVLGFVGFVMSFNRARAQLSDYRTRKLKDVTKEANNNANENAKAAAAPSNMARKKSTHKKPNSDYGHRGDGDSDEDEGGRSGRKQQKRRWSLKDVITRRPSNYEKYVRDFSETLFEEETKENIPEGLVGHSQ